MSKSAKFRKLAILGDSSTLPRPEHGISIDDTYPMRLATVNDLIVLDKSKISADTNYFLEGQQLFYNIKYLSSEFFVVNLGICDCSPRILSKTVKKILAVLEDFRFLRYCAGRYINYKSKNRLYYTKSKCIQNVPIERFDLNIRKIIDEILISNPVKKIFLINIIEPSKELDSRSYNFRKIVKKYNDCLYQIAQNHKEIVELIDINEYTKSNENTVTPDGHHFDSTGHAFITEQILRKIQF